MNSSWKQAEGNELLFRVYASGMCPEPREELGIGQTFVSIWLHYGIPRAAHMQFNWLMMKTYPSSVGGRNLLGLERTTRQRNSDVHSLLQRSCFPASPRAPISLALWLKAFTSVPWVVMSNTSYWELHHLILRSLTLNCSMPLTFPFSSLLSAHMRLSIIHEAISIASTFSLSNISHHITSICPLLSTYIPIYILLAQIFWEALTYTETGMWGS
jgi:hypothetical protein